MNTGTIPKQRTPEMPFERLIFLEPIPRTPTRAWSHMKPNSRRSSVSILVLIPIRRSGSLPRSSPRSGPTSRPRGGHGEPVCSRERLFDAAAAGPGYRRGGTGPPETMPKPSR